MKIPCNFFEKLLSAWVYRHECKYEISLSDMFALQQRLQAVMQTDEHADTTLVQEYLHAVASNHICHQ